MGRRLNQAKWTCTWAESKNGLTIIGGFMDELHGERENF